MDLTNFTLVQYKLSECFRDFTTEFFPLPGLSGFTDEIVQSLTAARRHEFGGKGPLSPKVPLSGWMPPKRLWHVDATRKPYMFYELIFDHDLTTGEATHEEVLDLLDVLMDEMAARPNVRSVLMREILRLLPTSDMEKRHELEAYARAAGM